MNDKKRGGGEAEIGEPASLLREEWKKHRDTLDIDEASIRGQKRDKRVEKSGLYGGTRAGAEAF